MAAFEVVNGSNLVLLFDTEPDAGDDVLGQSAGARSQSEPLVGGFLLGGLPDGLADVAFLLAPHFASGLGVDLVAAGHEARGSQHWRGHVCGPDAARSQPAYEGETLTQFCNQPLVWVFVVLEELLQEDGTFGARDRLHLGCEAGASVVLGCGAGLLLLAHQSAVMGAELGQGGDG